MRKFAILAVTCLIALALPAQTAKNTTTKPVAKAATASTTTKSAATTPAAQHPKAIFNTTAGQITCTLFPEKAPMTVANFIGLATGTKDWTNPSSGAKMHGKPLYDGTVFHRVIPGFMIQGGDPLGNGTGDPGYKFKDEFSDLTFDQPGRLAMANSGPNTNGSQFFITEVPTPHLNGRHTIFGQCDNPDIVKKITSAPRGMNDRPLTDIRITKLTIVKSGQTAAKPTPKPTSKPAPKPAS